MWLNICILVFLVAQSLAVITTTSEPYSEYVVTDSIECNAAGVSFDLDTKSFIYKQFDEFALFVNNTATGCKGAKWLKKVPGQAPKVHVTLYRAQCEYDLTTAYGIGERPVAYGVMLYFYAMEATFGTGCPDYACVPDDGHKYYFPIYCLYPAVAHIHTNHSIHDGGPNVNPHGKIPKPNDHVSMNITDDNNDNLDGQDVYAGDKIRALLALSVGDDTYSSMLPWYCYFAAELDNPVGFRIPFISGGCPSDDIGNWEVIREVKKANKSAYYVEFDAFTMNGQFSGDLFVICDIYLCVEDEYCKAPSAHPACWGDKKSKRKRSVSNYHGSRNRRDVPDQSANPDSYGNFYAETSQSIHVQYRTGPSTKGPVEPSSNKPNSNGNFPDWLIYVLVVIGAFVIFAFFLCCICFICGITLFGIGYGNRHKDSRHEEDYGYDNYANQPKEYRYPNMNITQRSAPY